MGDFFFIQEISVSDWIMFKQCLEGSVDVMQIPWGK